MNEDACKRYAKGINRGVQIAKGWALSLRWIHIGSPNIGVSGASRSAFLTSTSENSLSKYLDAAEDV